MHWQLPMRRLMPRPQVLTFRKSWMPTTSSGWIQCTQKTLKSALSVCRPPLNVTAVTTKHRNQKCTFQHKSGLLPAAGRPTKGAECFSNIAGAPPPRYVEKLLGARSTIIVMLSGHPKLGHSRGNGLVFVPNGGSRLTLWEPLIYVVAAC